MNLINLLQSMYENLDNKWNFQPELLLEFNTDADLNEEKFPGLFPIRQRVYYIIIKTKSDILEVSIYDCGIYIIVIIKCIIKRRERQGQNCPSPIIASKINLFKSEFYEININHYLDYNKLFENQECYYNLIITIASPKEINIDLINQLAYSWEEYILSLDRILTSKEIIERIHKELNILNKT